MGLSRAIETFLYNNDIPFSVLEHSLSSCSMETAHYSHVQPSQLAKAVIVKNSQRYMVCVLPASHKLVMDWLDYDYDSHYQLASEPEITRLFPDCEVGAIPVLGQAYGMKVVWDNALRHVDSVYFEGGDHRHLIQVSHDDFLALMEDADHATISCSADTIQHFQNIH